MAMPPLSCRLKVVVKDGRSTSARILCGRRDCGHQVGTLEEWDAVVLRAEADFDCGTFLLDRLGAERYLDPTLMAVLLTLRRRLIDEHGAATAAELMIIDCAVLSYYHTLRVNGWIGDAARWLESEFFGKERLMANLPDGGEVREARGLAIEYIVEEVVQKLMPLLDRSNRMMIRNLKALRALREPTAPSVSIARAGQVNVAAKQENTVRSGDPRDAPPE